jgi:hypothetical protein
MSVNSRLLQTAQPLRCAARREHNRLNRHQVVNG